MSTPSAVYKAAKARDVARLTDLLHSIPRGSYDASWRNADEVHPSARQALWPHHSKGGYIWNMRMCYSLYVLQGDHTALTIAAQLGYMDVVALLVEQGGAKVDATGTWVWIGCMS